MMPLLFFAFFLLAGSASVAAPPIETLDVPTGFSIDLYSDQVPNARQIAIGDRGTVFVGSRRAGNVYALLDRDADDRADYHRVIASGLDQPSGIAFYGGDLYIAAVNRIYRLPDIETRLESPVIELVSDKLPRSRHHGWKYLGVGPDERLYFNIGAPCNVCLHPDPLYATISRMGLDGGQVEIFARGVRNSVGFDWHPDGALWFSDNGRDYLGDDRPHDEINRAVAPGEHFGFPFRHGVIRDFAFPFGRGIDYQEPALLLPAHVAPLGVAFYRGDQFPALYRGGLFIAEHGSWNRSSKVGYRVTWAQVGDAGAKNYQPFIRGWLRGEEAWGRPADIEMMRDGSLLIADDLAGALYRVSYGAP